MTEQQLWWLIWFGIMLTGLIGLSVLFKENSHGGNRD